MAKTGTGAIGVPSFDFLKRPKCMVHFRPHDAYKGEFGFDWLRIKDNGLEKEPDYESIIEAGYKDGTSDLSSADAYKALKNEYKKLDIWGFGFGGGSFGGLGFGEYRIPYLNLFPKTYSDTVNMNPKPPYEAELKVLVEIKEKDVEEIKLEYNKDIFSIDGQATFSLKDKAVCPLKISDNGTIKITCKKEITTDIDGEIIAYAYYKDHNGVLKKSIAGKIQVGKNDKSSIKEAKFVFVGVRTNIQGIKGGLKVGKFSAAEQSQLRQTLYQALIRPLISIGRKTTRGSYQDITLDMTGDARFQTGGMYLDASGVNIQKGSGANSLVKYLKTKFINDPNNAAYIDHIPVFVIGEPGGTGGLLGYCDSDRDASTGKLIRFIKNSVSFTPASGRRRVETMPHESLHGLQLFHTHRDGTGPLQHANIKYIYPHGQTGIPANATDNVMSYRLGKMWTTWQWQWQIMRSNI